MAMSEYATAKQQVLPYLYNELKWPPALISDYGRVPVSMGGTTVWADFVCYISRESRAIPWLLVEVKKKDSSFDAAFSQAESYSLMLRAPFFLVTNGQI